MPAEEDTETRGEIYRYKLELGGGGGGGGASREGVGYTRKYILLPGYRCIIVFVHV